MLSALPSIHSLYRAVTVADLPPWFWNETCAGSFQRRQGGSCGLPGAASYGCTRRSTARKAAWRSASPSA
jgi:hypothetical protein